MARILYIDDDALMTEIMVDSLREIGQHEVVYKSSAEDAAAAVTSSEPFDLIVLDIMMRKGALEAAPGEGQTGYILYRLIRKARADIPIIVLTVLKQDQSPAVLRADKGLTWMRKPVDALDLHARILEEVSR